MAYVELRTYVSSAEEDYTVKESRVELLGFGC